MPKLLWPVIYAIGFASAGSAVGLLVNRPFRGAVVGLILFVAYCGAVIWFVWTY
jgi:hypothetical protein